MRDKTIRPLILFLFLCISALIALALFIAGQQRSAARKNTDLSLRADQISDTYAQARLNPVADPEDRTEEALDPASPKQPEPDPDMKQITEQIIFVGDSRTVGMHNAMAQQDDQCLYCAESGEGFNWFEKTGYPQMEQLILSHPKSPVVLNLGVNDLHHLKSYLTLYRTLDEVFPETPFFFMSVNPVTEKAQVKNETIENFNRSIQAVFPRQFIDTYHWMTETGFECGDGLHYSEDTYRAIHDYITQWIRDYYSE